MKEQRYEKIVELVRECGQLVKNADRQHLHVVSNAVGAFFIVDPIDGTANRTEAVALAFRKHLLKI